MHNLILLAFSIFLNLYREYSLLFARVLGIIFTMITSQLFFLRLITS